MDYVVPEYRPYTWLSAITISFAERFPRGTEDYTSSFSHEDKVVDEDLEEDTEPSLVVVTIPSYTSHLVAHSSGSNLVFEQEQGNEKVIIKNTPETVASVRAWLDEIGE